MTKDEALKMASEVPLIELLRSVPENAKLIVDSGDGISSTYHPVGYLCHNAAEALAQPAQEPVAWIYEWEDEKAVKLTFHPDSKAKVIPLYTHPAPTWQGLSDDELDALNGSPMALEYSGLYKFARAIEQTLREKNT